MKIATWNVNSVKARLPHVTAWLEEAAPDVLLLQELKVTEEAFPRAEIEALGYHATVVGQKTYNGVAILSRQPAEDIVTALPGDLDDDHARYVEATVGGVRVAAIYLPNGNPVDTDKYPYKLAWMDRLYDHVRRLLRADQAVVLGGDYNVIPTEADAYDPAAWTDDALFRQETRRRYRALIYLGLTDAFRALHPDDRHSYTFWDYQRGRWHRDEGIRIDHLLLSPQAADRLTACEIDRGPRGKERASDHTPIWCELGDEIRDE